MKEKIFKQRLAKLIVRECFRNTILEDYHSGISPSSKIGDFSDVKVVTPYGEIEWTKVSRFNNDEMKALMIESVDKMFTTLYNLDNKEFYSNMKKYLKKDPLKEWDTPKLNTIIE